MAGEEAIGTKVYDLPADQASRWPTASMVTLAELEAAPRRHDARRLQILAATTGWRLRDDLGSETEGASTGFW